MLSEVARRRRCVVDAFAPTGFDDQERLAAAVAVLVDAASAFFVPGAARFSVAVVAVDRGRGNAVAVAIRSPPRPLRAVWSMPSSGTSTVSSGCGLAVVVVERADRRRRRRRRAS